MGNDEVSSSAHGTKDEPLALLVGVDEDSTCSYRARVCAPLLCPKPTKVPTPNDPASSNGDATSTTTKTASSNGDATSATGTSASTTDLDAASKKDPVTALFDALFGEGFMEGNEGPVQIIWEGGGVNGQDFQEFVTHVQNGGEFENHPLFEQLKVAVKKSHIEGWSDSAKAKVMEVKDGMSLREILANTLGQRPCLLKKAGWWTYEFCYSKHIRQYHADSLANGKTQISTEHLLGMFKNSGNNVEDYPPEDEHLHVFNATSGASSAADKDIGNRKGSGQAKYRGGEGMPTNKKQPGGNGAVYVQEYNHGDVCDHEDVAESVIKGGNVVQGAVERSSTVRFSCGKHPELVDIKEDSTCHYILDVTLPELCQHALFQAPVTKTQVVKCLPV